MFASDVNDGDTLLATQYNNLRRDRLPLGSIMPFAGSTAPSNWLICNGQAVGRVAYADLFALIGTNFGLGDGSTTFNIPNISDKFPIGSSGTKAVGSSGGGTVTLIEGNLPSHTHTISNQSAHNHEYYDDSSAGSETGFSIQGAVTAALSTAWGTDNDHNHTGTTNITGSSEAIDIIPLYICFNYIIKAIG